MQLSDFQNLHKADLHRHFDGSVRCSTLFRIFKEQGLTNAVIGDLDALTLEKLQALLTPCGQTLEDYLKMFDVTLLAMQTEANLRVFAREFVEDAKLDNVTHVELRYAPLLHTRCGLSALQVHAAVDDACASAARDFGVSVSIIVCAMKTQSESDSDCLLGLFEAPHKLCMAYDQAGPEAGFYNFSDFPHHFSWLRDHEIPITLHAGEASGGENVLRAIESGARRVGHGVRAQESDAAMALARQQKVLFEMCPTSNLQTHVYGVSDDLSDYPLLRYLQAGIPCTICTDNPLMSACTSSGEFYRLYQALHMTPAQVLLLLDLGFAKSFLFDKQRDGVRKNAFAHNVQILRRFDADVESEYAKLIKSLQ